MLWVDTIFLITFSMYMVRISHWKSMFKTFDGGKQQCHIHFVWKLMIQCSFLYVPSNTDISPANNFSRSGPTWHPSAESYLHGHNVKGSKFNDHMDGGGSSSSSDECGMVRGKCKIRTV